MKRLGVLGVGATLAVPFAALASNTAELAKRGAERQQLAEGSYTSAVFDTYHSFTSYISSQTYGAYNSASTYSSVCCYSSSS